ncbi:MAG: PepSY domain-containing protein [Thermoleophilaceae bacterium]|jgi:uncharacterized membrane protein YkoI|nr:PepSY domain-containing protein [Thermoleophilaceae bacterium]
MPDKIKGMFIAGVALVALAIGGAAIAGAAGDETPAGAQSAQSQAPERNDAQDAEDREEGPDKAITGQPLERAGAAALDHTNGGRVTGTEEGDEEGAYEIEVTREDGNQVDVHLDRNFQVLGTEGDDGQDE